MAVLDCMRNEKVFVCTKTMCLSFFSLHVILPKSRKRIQFFKLRVVCGRKFDKCSLYFGWSKVRNSSNLF